MADETFVITYKEDRGMIDKCGHDYKMVTGSLSFSASYTNTGTYATSGEDLDLRKIFPKDLHIVLFGGQVGYNFEYDYTYRKVHAYVPAGTEATNEANLFTAGLIDVRFIAIGK